MPDWILCVGMIFSWVVVFAIIVTLTENRSMHSGFFFLLFIPISLTIWFIKYCNQEWDYETTTPVVRVHVIDGQAIAIYNGKVYPLNEMTNLNFEDGEEVLFKQQKKGPYLGIYATHTKLLIERK